MPCLEIFGLPLPTGSCRANPGSEFAEFSELKPNGKTWSQMKLTLAKV